MKTTMLFLFASLLVNASAFAAPGPNASAKCKEIADKVRQAKAQPAAAAPAQPAQPGPATGTTVR